MITPVSRPRVTIPGLVIDRGVALGVAVLAGIVAGDIVIGVQVSGGYAAAAIVTSMLSSTRQTAAVSALTVLMSFLAGTWQGNFGQEDWALRLFICTCLAALAVLAAAVRTSREAKLQRMTVIAETAQRAVLRTLPKEIGSIGFAARYVSATAEALVGGDLYEVAATPYGVRVIVGDVRGKGIEAVQTAATVLGAFRQAAFTTEGVGELAAFVDAALAPLIGDEEFVTAIIGEFAGDSVSLANCGHHPPVLVTRSHTATELDTGEASVPLGLGAAPAITQHPWPQGARMLFYTDGLIEARNGEGRFFPLADHLGQLGHGSLDDALDRLIDGLMGFAGHMGDDMALVLTQNNS